ncbi:hypothetical protein QBC46DRAFT_85601 [Diplogelasinospora grovesii]|uniref:Uncharacterized protein n=1 Tax=Diplogelasinospora grovesii TaxID=303347 RepID=A0AAN6MYH5_9PEZI|nr:hypothetical protein QBC46DRAFT_85601 [Diplogelasinospora grovesii]
MFVAFLLLCSFISLGGVDAFSLNVSGPDWDYTTKDLAGTTSTSCKQAFSLDIACDETLLGIVASMRPAFDPTASDLDRTCVQTCNDSIAAYLSNVEGACSGEGDLADLAISSNTEIPAVPVSTVGEVFRFMYARACERNETGYCYLNYPQGSDWALPEGVCDDDCAKQWYADAHVYPGAGYRFLEYSLVNQSDWWMGNYEDGWEEIQKCEGQEEDGGGDDGGDGDASSTMPDSATSTAGSGTGVGNLSATTTTSHTHRRTSTTAAASATVSTSSGERLRSIGDIVGLMAIIHLL